MKEKISMDYVKCEKKNLRVNSYKPLVLEYTNTKRREFVMGDDYNYLKIGHIEVSITENEKEYFAERLEKFLDEACNLYNEIVLGNTNLDCEFKEVKGKVF